MGCAQSFQVCETSSSLVSRSILDKKIRIGLDTPSAVTPMAARVGGTPIPLASVLP